MRTCDNCGKEMSEGYCLDDGEQYICSDECLLIDGYTTEDRDADYNNGTIYYTEWEEEDD